MNEVISNYLQSKHNNISEETHVRAPPIAPWTLNPEPDSPGFSPHSMNFTCSDVVNCANKKRCWDFFCSNLKKISHPPCSIISSDKSSNINDLIKNEDCTLSEANYLYNKVLNCVGCKQKGNGGGLSGGAIAGIVVGSVVGLALIIFLIYKFKKK